jgi:Xaa-Pro aminopeptidase
MKERNVRLSKLRQSLLDQNVDAVLVGQPENRRYLSGFTGSTGWLIITAGRQVLATDFRYYEQVEREAPAFELAKVTGKYADILPGLLVDLGVKRLGYESQHLTVDQWSTWSEATKEVEWVPLKSTVETIRMVKDEGEMEAIRRSVALTDAAFAHLLEGIRPGMTELEAAWEIEAYMRTHGASKTSFDLIVAAGPNGALPHARPGERILQPGEPIVVDIGCALEGYCSDMTRTFCFGQPSPKYLEVWDIVRRAQEAAGASIRAGVSGLSVDAAARDLITAAGYGEAFGHGLGHGVGLAVHESPSAGRLSEDTLQAGMTLTVEPGIYLPGEFGVRLEDLVIIHEQGMEILTNTPKMPVID